MKKIAAIIILFGFIGCSGGGNFSNGVVFDPNKLFRLEDPDMYRPGYEIYFHGSTNSQYYPNADVRLKTRKKENNALPVEIVLKLWSINPIDIRNLRFSFITYFDPNKRPVKKVEIDEHNNPTTFYPKDAILMPLDAKIGDLGILTSWIPEYNKDLTIKTDWRLEPTNNMDFAQLITTITRYKFANSETAIKIDQYGDPKSYKYTSFNDNLIIYGNRCGKIDIQWDL